MWLGRSRKLRTCIYYFPCNMSKFAGKLFEKGGVWYERLGESRRKRRGAIGRGRASSMYIYVPAGSLGLESYLSTTGPSVQRLLLRVVGTRSACHNGDRKDPAARRLIHHGDQQGHHRREAQPHPDIQRCRKRATSQRAGKVSRRGSPSSAACATRGTSRSNTEGNDTETITTTTPEITGTKRRGQR